MKIGEYNSIVSASERARDIFFNDESASYRVVTKVWKHILLTGKDELVTKGRLRRIVAKSLGAGVYELTLKE
jgi:hypothetical protein